MTGPSNRFLASIPPRVSRSQARVNERFGQSSAVRSPVQVARRLLRYLAERLGIHGLKYRCEPKPVTDGWETYIYHFELDNHPILPAGFCGPLTLRLFPGSLAISRGRRAFAVQHFLEQLAYPVPRPVCWEEDCCFLGGPFLIMEQIPGLTFFQRLLTQPWNFIPTVRQMVELQMRLHQVPVQHFPRPVGTLLQRSIGEMEDLISLHGLHSLVRGFEWLSRHRPDERESTSIVHLDFHPLNLIHANAGTAAVLDWDEADVGDPHADIATTSMLVHCAPRMAKTLIEQGTMAIGKRIVEKAYLFACRRRMDLHLEKLTYYQAWASLRRLTRCGRWLTGKPHLTGAKPSLIRHIERAHLNALCAYFRRSTGIRICLKGEMWETQAASA